LVWKQEFHWSCRLTINFKFGENITKGIFKNQKLSKCANSLLQQFVPPDWVPMKNQGTKMAKKERKKEKKKCRGIFSETTFSHNFLHSILLFFNLFHYQLFLEDIWQTNDVKKLLTQICNYCFIYLPSKLYRAVFRVT